MFLSAPSRGAAAVAAVLAAAFLATSCSGEAGQPAPPPASVPGAPPSDGGATADPRGTPREALEALLRAEAAGDHRSSYRLLTAGGRQALDLGDWEQRRSALAPITGFRIEDVKGDVVTALVDHEPGLDPFVGLRPAQERQRWRARREGSGWLIDADAEVTPLLPSDERASDPALQWARAVKSCDRGRAAALQAVPGLYGTSDGPDRLCGSVREPGVGPPTAVPVGPASQDLVAQYGAELYRWARAVPITGVDRPFNLVMAPLGDEWRVLGVFDA